VTDQGSIGRARDTILHSHPGLDTIVTMSGVMIPEDLRDPAHFGDAEKTIDTNLLGIIRVIGRLGSSSGKTTFSITAR
jgi:short-subunit dehydrogenase involved in D-alanine esterification of teichoic acids